MADVSLGSFSGRVRKLKGKFSESSDKIFKGLVLECFLNVDVNTPVDTGQARSNWFLGINAPNRTVLDEGFPESTKYLTGENTISDGEAMKIVIEKAAEANEILSKSQNIKEAWISNNLDYINRLNAGTSNQAPANFVDMAIGKTIKTKITVFE